VTKVWPRGGFPMKEVRQQDKESEYDQVRELYLRVMTKEQKKNLLSNTA
jgi:catalase